jgi:type III restriction enzyme
MADRFFEQPILNSPYKCPAQHWELGADGQPTNQLIPKRRRAEFITPIPKPKKQRQAKGVQKELILSSLEGLSTDVQQYDPNPVIAFKLRERLSIAAGTRKLLQGHGPNLETLETEGQMLQRVMPELMGMKNVLVINDEAHHCYREKPQNDDLDDLKGEEKDEAKKNNEAARLWISGIEMVKRLLGVNRVYDLSATPFFLRGSGYAEGTLFPWTMSDFSLMDAIECGIVKLPRVPVTDNTPGGDMPKFRNLWEHIRTKMPKKGRGKATTLDPLSLPAELQTALDALYGHYQQTYDLWQQAGISVPPVFIVVCNNTSTSKLVHDFISGFQRIGDDGETETYYPGRLELFRNYDEHGNRLARPRTLLIDSEQLESGDALDNNFREMAANEIDRFRRDLIQRGGAAGVENISDQDLLREVMNTVGKVGKIIGFRG